MLSLRQRADCGTRTRNRPITSRVRYQLRQAGTGPRARSQGTGRYGVGVGVGVGVGFVEYSSPAACSTNWAKSS